MLFIVLLLYVTVAVPLFPPLQLTFVTTIDVIAGASMLLIFTVVVAVQLFSSVAVTLYAPATTLFTKILLLTFGFHVYIKFVPIPPEAEMLAEPFGCPQLASVTDVTTT